MTQISLTISLLAIFLHSTLSQYSTYGSGYPSNYGNSLINKAYNSAVGYGPISTGPISTGLSPNIETNQVNLASISSNLASGLVGISPYASETIVPVAIENTNGYGGSGTGEMSVAGEMPVVGTTNVGGQVPVTGSVRFAGDVPAGGIISVAATCGCGFSNN